MVCQGLVVESSTMRVEANFPGGGTESEAAQ
jgi:hypothetical protein